MRRSSALIIGSITIAMILTGCSTSPGTAPTPPHAEQPGSSQTDGAAPSAPEAEPARVNAADLPEWFPTAIPMPAGDYRRTVPDDAGATLTFDIADEQVILDLVAALDRAGYALTAADDHGEGWKTWFTESTDYRANIAARDLGTADAWIDYRIEPK